MAAVVTYDHDFGGLSSPIPTSYLDDDFGNAADALASLNTFSNYLLDTGAANAYVVTLGAGLTATLTNGLMIQVKIANANTTASTLNFNGTGAKSIKNIDGSAPVAGQLPASSIVTFIYSTSGTAWFLMTPYIGVVPGNLSVAGTLALGTSGMTVTGTATGWGFGVTPSAWSVGKALEVGFLGSALWSDAIDDVYLTGNTYYNSGFKFAAESGYATSYSQAAGVHSWATSSVTSTGAGNTATMNALMVLGPGPNLGVGISSSPSATLTIAGAQSGFSSLRLTVAGGTPSAPVSGDIWSDGTTIFWRNASGVTKSIALV